MSHNNLVHGLWIEGKLSPLELLTIESFLHQGYEFHLWSYDLKGEVPKQIKLRDAREIISEQDVFSYAHQNQFGHGKGSYAGFSDIFRYRLLYLHGGWWTDMDMTCLRRLPEQNYYFRAHNQTYPAVGNLIFCPPQSAVMNWCYQQAQEQVTAHNQDWNLPIRILNEGIQKFELEQYITTGTSTDSWAKTRLYLGRKSIPSHLDAIHWMHEEWRRLGISKNSFPTSSNLYQLMQRYGVNADAMENWSDIFSFYIRISWLFFVLKSWGYWREFL